MATFTHMDPFQRQHQITIPSSRPVKRMGVEMINKTAQRRGFQGKKVNKQIFYNCLIYGVYEYDAREDLDFEEVRKKGLLAVLFDRGAAGLSRIIASEDEPFMPKGVPASFGDWDDDEDEDDEDEAGTPVVEPRAVIRRPPLLIIPLDFARPREDEGVDRAQEVEKPGEGSRPMP